MSDLDNFKAMLDKTGFKYKQDKKRLFHWRQEKQGPECHYLEVRGLFYEELHCWFDLETGDLLNMFSHVAFWDAACPRAKEIERSLT